MKAKFYDIYKFRFNFVLFNIFPPLFLTNIVEICTFNSDGLYILPNDDEYPEQVVLEHGIERSGNASARGIYCGGTLVTYQHVIVSANCFSNFVHICHIIGQKVYSGMVNYLEQNESKVQTRVVTDYTIYPEYTIIGQSAYSLVILTLDKPFNISVYTKPALMSFGDPQIGTKCQLIFWRKKEHYHYETQLMIVIEQYRQKCEKKSAGIMCFRISGASYEPSKVLYDDVYSAMYCDNLFAGILVRSPVENYLSKRSSTKSVDVLSAMYFRSWIHEVLLSQETSTPMSGLVRSIEWHESSSPINSISNLSIWSSFFVIFLRCLMCM